MFFDDTVMLCPITADDRDAIAGFFNDPDLFGLRQIDHDALAPLGEPAIESAIEEWAAAKTGLALTITPAGSDHIVGYALCDWGWDAMSPWLGLVVDPRHQRHGYGSAAARLVIDWLLGQTVAHSIQAWTPAWNDAGIAFLGALGFAPAGGIRRAWLRDGVWYDNLAFDLLRFEWEAA